MGPGWVEAQAARRRRSAQSAGSWLGVSPEPSGSDPLWEVALRGLSPWQWWDGIVEPMHVSCRAQALGGLGVRVQRQ
jgi:hypothetical protein